MADAQHVCPWWLAYTFDNPFRKLFHRPERIFSSMVCEGMTVADIGCGMGYFSIGMAGLVGTDGKVIALDVQREMLMRVERRARKAGLASVVETQLCRSDDLGIDEPLDFALAFWMVHEIPDPQAFFVQVGNLLNPDGRLLVTEPKFHVSAAVFEAELAMAKRAGLSVSEHPDVAFSRAAVLKVG